MKTSIRWIEDFFQPFFFQKIQSVLLTSKIQIYVTLFNGKIFLNSFWPLNKCLHSDLSSTLHCQRNSCQNVKRFLSALRFVLDIVAHNVEGKRKNLQHFCVQICSQMAYFLLVHSNQFSLKFQIFLNLLNWTKIFWRRNSLFLSCENVERFLIHLVSVSLIIRAEFLCNRGSYRLKVARKIVTLCY